MKNKLSKRSSQKARLNRNDEIDFLRDFDLLTTISTEEATLYQEANF